MRKIRNIFFVLISLFVLTSCNKDKKKEEPINDNPPVVDPVVEETEFKVSYVNDSGKVLKEYVVKKGEDAPFELKASMGYYYDLVDGSKEDLKNIQKESRFVVDMFEKDVVIDYLVDGETYYNYQGKFFDNVPDPKLPDYFDRCTWKMELTEGETEDHIVYSLQYSLKKFKVQFYIGSSVVSEQSVEYNTAAVEPELEDRISVVWDQDFSKVTSDLTIKGDATFDYLNINYYIDGKLADLAPQTFEPNESVTLPVPTKENYIFEGWYLSDISLTNYKTLENISDHDITLYARFTQIGSTEEIKLPQADLHFNDIKYVPVGSSQYGYQPVMPSGIPSSVTLYKWTTSDSSVLTVSEYSTLTGHKTGFAVLTATGEGHVINAFVRVTATGITVVSEEDVNDYSTVKVTFEGLNGRIIEEKLVRKGFSTNYPVPPTEEGYAFVAWEGEPFGLMEDTVIHAIYDEHTTNKYQGKKIAIIGDSISTYQFYIPEGYRHFYPYPTADILDINYTWWMQTVNRLGASLFINNSYSGSCVCLNYSEDSSNPVRLSKLVISGETPDVVIIYMGSNDAYAKRPDLFESGYEKMINEINRISPNTEIIVCTLPGSNLYTDENKVKYNNIIRQMATKFDLQIIELADFSLVGHIVDSAHPNHAGMTLIADKIVSTLID